MERDQKDNLDGKHNLNKIDKSKKLSTFYKVFLASIVIIGYGWFFHSITKDNKDYDNDIVRFLYARPQYETDETIAAKELKTSLNLTVPEEPNLSFIQESITEPIKYFYIELNDLLTFNTKDIEKNMVVALAKKDHITKEDFNVIPYIHDYFKACKVSVDLWIPKRKLLVKTKLDVLNKYQHELNTSTNLDIDDIRLREIYIDEYKDIDSNVSRTHLLKLLKEKSPKELQLVSYIDTMQSDTVKSLEKMHDCINNSEKLLSSLYYHWDEYLRYDDPRFPISNLRNIAKDLRIGKDLDFKVIDILIEEAVKFKSIKELIGIHPYDILSQRKSKDEDLKLIIIKPIIEETNKKLAKINPDNTGFKTATYKFRMHKNEVWKKRLDKIQLQSMN